jgi:1,2-diacylglycerol 3-beta-galactosyltransferase
MMGRILILMSNTGGGHRASAEALQAGFHLQFGDRFQVDVIDLLTDYLFWPLNRLPQLYPVLSNDATWLWRLLWKSGNFPGQSRRIVDLVAREAAIPVTRAFQEYRPDLIVSVHPLFHEVTLRSLARLGWHTPLATVVTDLATVHPLWFHPAVTRCFVGSQAAYQRARRAGLSAEQLRLYGLPIRPAFAQPLPPTSELRAHLAMHPTLPAALLIGGGEGMGSVGTIAQAVARELAATGPASGQLVVICGRNRRLYKQLNEQPWPLPVVVKGFVDNMHEWMAACDCIVTKAGPGTIAEALVCGLPILISGFIPGQEEGNVPFVLEHAAGAYSEEPAEIAQIVGGWFGHQAATRQRFAENARRLGRPQATMQIVQSLAELVA